GASSADWSIAKPVNGWRPLKQRLPDKRRADLHSVRPTLSLQDAPPGMAIWQATAGFLAHGSSPAPPSRVKTQWFLVQAFRSQLLGQLRLRVRPGNFPQIARARYSLLVLPEDRTPSARDSFRRKRLRVNPFGNLAGCPDGSDMILSPPIG